jgi:hypothetical protein
MATTKKAPLTRVNELHGDKEKLVDRLLGLIDLGGVDKETVKARLLAVSNKKLLRMFEVANEVKQKYGTPEKLADAVAAAVGKAKDKAYLEKLGAMAKRQPARLLDLLRVATKKGKAA